MNTVATPASTAYPAGYGVERAQYGVYDKPADRRLRPWIIAGSAFLTTLGVLMIIFTFVQEGNSQSLWGLLVAGIILCAVSILGYLAGFTLRSQLAGLFFWALLLGFIGSLVVLIVNGAKLSGYMNDRCAGAGFTRTTVQCQNLREYHYIVYTVFGVAFSTVVPTILATAGYFWRTTRLYRKEPYEGARHDAYGNRYPVGSAAI
eukprot:TRINITY_DN26_c0_g1_i2.p1 TRINITY_DN26_c0_g1~~TRINITY_DN26_c0_g1_i2.p1  ORF type:complete len:204 (+),score=43.82 TRINITY_DN26_c0_g1_i2:88-699(+)